MRRSLTVLLAMTAVIVSCGSLDAVNESQTQRPLESSTELTTGDGRRFVLAPSGGVARAVGSRSVRTSIVPKPVDAMDLDELAEALRPVTFVGGREYRLDTPDYEAASLVKAEEVLGGESYSPEGDAIGVGASPKSYCCGADGRSVVRNNTVWPYKTVLAMAIPDDDTYSWTSGVHGECTMQLIGPSTAISVAHCFHDGVDWLDLAMWGAGPDAQDSPIFPVLYPGAYGCYLVYIPTAWIGSGGNFQYDYAVIDFRNTCQPAPGSDVGWLGWGAYSDEEIEGNAAYAYGVPTLKPYPQIRGMWTSSSTIVTGAYSVDHGADCSDGDSGRGLRQYVGEDWRVTAVHSRGPANSKCRDRRITSEVTAFISANSEF